MFQLYGRADLSGEGVNLGRILDVFGTEVGFAQVFADRHGLRVDDIDSLVFVLTGMRGVDFRQKYQVRIANQLLRYTDMTVAEVAKRSGIGSANNLYLTYKREYNLAPGYRRQRIRQPGDLGRFKL